MATVNEFMTSEPAFCTSETSLQDVARMMCQHSCGEIPVVDSPEQCRPMGVVTDRDITCRALAQGKDALKLRVKDCMTANPVTVRRGQDIERAIELMQRHKIRRIPVVDDEGRLCGILAQADIARKAPYQKTAEVLREVSQPV